jgi:predicted ATPase
MLRDPNPPRLTCLEEVDHGLHPHALDVLVERLREASERSQIIVATHSPALVNRIAAEELVVFEKNLDSGVTEVPKLDPKTIKKMEEESDLRIGELWYSGLLGGAPR